MGAERDEYKRILTDLRRVQQEIEDYYSKECERVKIQAKIQEINSNEKVRIFHHENHRKHIRKSTISKLETKNCILKVMMHAKLTLKNR